MAGGEEAAGHMVNGFNMKSHQISRGESWKRRGSGPGLSTEQSLWLWCKVNWSRTDLQAMGRMKRGL